MSGSNISFPNDSVVGTMILAPLEGLASESAPREIYSIVAQVIGSAVAAERVLLVPTERLLRLEHKIIEWSVQPSDLDTAFVGGPEAAAAGSFHGNPRGGRPSGGTSGGQHADSDAELLRLALAIQDRTVQDCGELSIHSPEQVDHLLGISLSNGLRSQQFLARTIQRQGRMLTTAIAFRSNRKPAWSELESALFAEICAKAALRIDTVAADSSRAETSTPAPSRPVVPQLERLIEQSEAVFFHTTADHLVKFISGRSVDFFGVPQADFAKISELHWYDLVHLEDRPAIVEHIQQLRSTPVAFEHECRAVHLLTGAIRWMLVRCAPVFSENGELVGWDGLGIDISRRRASQQALESQSKRIRALLTVSSAIRGYLDPASIAARGVSALCEATSADAGLCFLLSAKEEELPELVAFHGFSESFAQNLKLRSTLPVSSSVAEHGEPLVISDLRTDPRASRTLAEQEGMRSALFVPVTVEDTVLGVISLYHRKPNCFTDEDVQLVSAAANQIGLASRQANLFAVYRRQTKNLAALYRLSHELTGGLTLDQIFQKAFAIIRDEVGIKRMWLGLLNETGTRIIGQAAFGPGWKRRLVEINVEVAGRDHPIADVVTKRVSRIIDDPDRVLNEFGARRFFSRFSISSVGLVPLISAGQLLGVLAFQPSNDQPTVDEEELSLVENLGSEIAAVVLSRRLDERIGEAEKMRAAGLLAAGIAHNFNNLLQAILGQASLLEMQAGETPQIARALQIINESAAKGATLVRQLMSFAHLEEPSVEVIDVNTIVERSKKALSRNLKPGQHIRYSLAEELPKSQVDSGQILRILMVLVSNASEASPEGAEIEVFSDAFGVDRDRPHFEVPYGDYLRVGVRDHGIGMDEEAKRRCFEPFYTTKNVDPSSGLSLSGAGLGLAAAFALARKNGGRLVVDSRKGHGSVFTLYVPVARAQRDLTFGERKAAADTSSSAPLQASRSSRSTSSARAESSPVGGRSIGSGAVEPRPGVERSELGARSARQTARQVTAQDPSSEKPENAGEMLGFEELTVERVREVRESVAKPSEGSEQGIAFSGSSTSGTEKRRRPPTERLPK